MAAVREMLNEERGELVESGESSAPPAGDQGTGLSRGVSAVEILKEASVAGTEAGDPEVALRKVLAWVVEMAAEENEARKALKEAFQLPRNAPNKELEGRIWSAWKEKMVGEGGTTGVESEEVGEERDDGEGEGEESGDGGASEGEDCSRVVERAELERALTLFGHDVVGLMQDMKENILETVRVEFRKNQEFEVVEVRGEKKEKQRTAIRRKAKKRAKKEAKIVVLSEESEETEFTDGSSSSEQSSDFSESSDESESWSDESGCGRSCRKRSKKKDKEIVLKGKVQDMDSRTLRKGGDEVAAWLRGKKKKMAKSRRHEVKSMVSFWKTARKSNDRRGMEKALKRMRELGRMVCGVPPEVEDEGKAKRLFGKEAAKAMSSGGGGRKEKTVSYASVAKRQPSVKGFRPSWQGNFQRNSGRGRNIPFGLPPRFRGGCYQCGQQGHMARDCTNEKVCWTCDKPGHVQAQCRQE